MQSEKTEKRERKGQKFFGEKRQGRGRRKDTGNDGDTGINVEEKNGSMKTEREEKRQPIRWRQTDIQTGNKPKEIQVGKLRYLSDCKCFTK